MALRPGLATPEGTRTFAERGVTQRGLPRTHFRALSDRRLLSSLGLGTYIGAADAPTDVAVEQAVSVAVGSGRVNVLDTAINYRHQRAERSVGRALGRLFDRGEVERAAVFVATKQGYLAPDAEAGVSASEWVERELLRTGLLAPEDVVDGSHAMTPKYLADQFERSRRNLGLAAVDLLYLHNAPDAQLARVGRAEFSRRLNDAFRLYESWRTEGRVGYYGLATWDSLRARPDAPGFFPLEEAVRIATEVGGADHGLRFVQFPFNVAMPEAATLRNQPVDGRRETLFRAAHRLGVRCFTSVPLLQGQLARGGPVRDGLSAAQTALQFARAAPDTVAPLVGAKRPEHLSENLEVAGRPPWTDAEFRALIR